MNVRLLNNFCVCGRGTTSKSRSRTYGSATYSLKVCHIILFFRHSDKCFIRHVEQFCNKPLNFQSQNYTSAFVFHIHFESNRIQHQIFIVEEILSVPEFKKIQKRIAIAALLILNLSSSS